MKTVVILYPVIILASCGDNNDDGSNSEDDHISYSTEERLEFAAKNGYEIHEVINNMNEAVSVDALVTWTRDKEINKTQQEVKIGEGNLSFEVNDLSIATRGDFAVKQAGFVKNKQGREYAVVILDLTKLIGVQNIDNKIELANPEYLDVEKYPEGLIIVGPIRKGERQDVLVRIKDRSKVIGSSVELERSGKELTGLFATVEIDALDWELFNKNLDQDIEKDIISVNIELKK